MGIDHRLRRLEDARRPEPEDERERAQRMKEVREAAERENQRFLQEIIRHRRREYVQRVGVDNVTSEDARDENYLTDEDVPPFKITESG